MLGIIANIGHSLTGVHLTYIDPLGLPGDGGDKYAGLDRFCAVSVTIGNGMLWRRSRG